MGARRKAGEGGRDGITLHPIVLLLIALTLILLGVYGPSMLLGMAPAQITPSITLHDSGDGKLSMRALGAGGRDYSKPAVAMPSVHTTEVEEEALEKTRKIYGGKGDKGHLGGFTDIDYDGVNPTLWKWMLRELSIKSVVDVGCGKGVSTAWFKHHGAEVLCVEGSHDATSQSLLPQENIVEHDFSRGPYWPAVTYDAVWCVEFLEHVGRHYMKNYMPVFDRSGLIFASSSKWGGWHHVEVHKGDEWWKARFEAWGFIYSDDLTKKVRKLVQTSQDFAPDGKRYTGQHLWLSMLVFINPRVASLPEHDHLMGGDGCYDHLASKDSDQRKPCTGEDALSAQYLPLPRWNVSDQEWTDMVWPQYVGKATLPPK